MKAIIAEPPKNNSVKLVEIPKPFPEKGQVLLKTFSVGIDGTDREINRGMYGTPPSGSRFLILGHEAVGKVHEFGEEVDAFSKGDLVVPTVRRPCDENCINCQSGETDMCLTGNYYEHGIYRLHGFASEYAVSDASYLLKIPSGLKDVAALLEPLSIVEKAVTQIFQIQERLVWEPERAFVAGAGTLGLLAAMILRLRDLEVYVAATREKESLKAEIVRSIGGKYVNVRKTPIKSLRERFDIILEATGNVEVSLEVLKRLGINGVLCMLGIYREERACEEFGRVLTDMVLGNRLLFGSVNSNKKDFEKGVKDMNLIKSRYGNILDQLITKKLYPTDFEKAFKPDKEDIKMKIIFNN